MTSIFHTWGLFAVTLVVFAASMYVIVKPDKWDRAVAIKMCDGLPVVKLADGSTWLRYCWRYYRVEDVGKVC